VGCCGGGFGGEEGCGCCFVRDTPEMFGVAGYGITREKFHG